MSDLYHPVKRLFDANAKITVKVPVPCSEIYTLEYVWSGPIDGIAEISYVALKINPALMQELPWKLVEIGRQDNIEVAYFRREEFVKRK